MIKRRDILARHAMLTGSVAFGVAGRNSDEDWLIGPEELADVLVEFNPEIDQYGRILDGECNFNSVREGKYNLIVCHSIVFGYMWMKAHRHCKIERPRDKKRRIKIFRHYLYGEALS